MKLFLWNWVKAKSNLYFAIPNEFYHFLTNSQKIPKKLNSLKTIHVFCVKNICSRAVKASKSFRFSTQFSLFPMAGNRCHLEKYPKSLGVLWPLLGQDHESGKISLRKSCESVSRHLSFVDRRRRVEIVQLFPQRNYPCPVCDLLTGIICKVLLYFRVFVYSL